VSDAVAWRLLEELLDARFGLSFDDMRRQFAEARLRRRVEVLSLSTLLDYYHYLRFHPARDEEAEELKKLVTNNESYFFRGEYQLKALTDVVVPALTRPLERPLRALSAGCSAGEEAYSIAIVLSRLGERSLPHGYQVDGFDLSPVRIEQGRRAVYPETSLRACDEMQRAELFGALPNATFELRAAHRKAVRLFEGNLVAEAPATPFLYDVIFCRNVLIYFSALGFERALGGLARLLHPGGYLFIGHSESLLGRTALFRPETLGEAIAYRLVEKV
jgi:chemotaxis protein methyltransferase CheR